MALTLNGLPKRPPILFGDGFVLEGAPEFSGIVPNYWAADTSVVTPLLEIRELALEPA
ncbi:hypothetical protein D3C76_1788780 [compost metagenome]